MITRVKINPYLKNMSSVSEALRIELPPEPNGKMKLRVNMEICRFKIEISELSKGVILSRNFENIPAGYEAVLELNHLDPGAYIMQISCDNSTVSKQLILQ